MNRKVHYKKTHLLRAAFALLTMLLTAAPVAWVQQSATVNISTNNEWNEFVKDFNQDGVYDNITTVTVNITGDIVSSAMLGTSNRKFSGTINGNGHTFTFKKGNLSTYFNEQYAALFRYVNNVTIRDLHIDGEIYTSSKYAAAFIGSASGTNSIINCRSSVVIESSVNGDGTHAGFVATVASSASNTLIIEGCVFDGKLRGTNTHSCGGFIGWRGGSATVRIYNSLFAPSQITVGNEGSATFARNLVDTYNSYYTYLMNNGRDYAPNHGTDYDNNGQEAHSVTAISPLFINITPRTETIEYSVSGITIFKNGNTTHNVILRNGTYYAGIGQNIIVQMEPGYITNSSLSVSGVSSLSIIGNSNTWSFSMPSANITLSARNITPDPNHFSQNGDTYTIMDSTGWNVFCDCLQDTANYHRFTGKTVKPNANIRVTRMAGSSYHDMKGTFDGQGNTLTVSYGTDNNPINEQNVAPFRNAESGCYIKNLKVAGDIYTSAKNAAGLIGTMYGTVNIENCCVSTNIHSHTSGDGTHGGFVAYIGNNIHARLYIEGCLFNGRLLSSGSTATNNCGGFVGWRGNNAHLDIINSVYMPKTSTSIMGHTWISAQGSATFVRNGADNTSITNSYYSAKFNPNSNADNNSVTVQGKQMRKIFGIFLTINAFDSNPTTYTVSGIKAYVSDGDNAIMINNNLYSGKNNTLRLSLSALDDGHFYNVYNGTLSGTSDPYTLTIGENDADVAIAEENRQDCPPSIDLYVYGITANSANLSWVCYNTTTNFQIKRVRSGQTDTVINTVTANRDDNIFNTTISELSPNTEYNVYVRTYCGDNYNNNGYSPWSEATTFTTLEACPAGKVCIGFGDGSATTPTLPIDGHYRYSFTEQIYTADELGLNNDEAITSLDFFASVNILRRDLDIYIVNTDKCQFTNDNDWIPVTSADLVFSGRVTFNNTWNTITLDEPFAYTGGNICIVFDDNTGTANTYVTFRDFYSAGSSIFFRSDSDNPDPINGINISGSKVDVKNIIRVGKGTMPSCRRPYGLTATNVTSRQAKISWTEAGSATSWKLAYKTTDDENYIEINVTNNSHYTFTDLNPSTTYTFKVCAVSGQNTSNWSAPYTFTTPDACPAPTDLLASNIKSNSAKLSWTSSASSWKLAYKTYDADNYTEIDVNNPYYTLTGLHPAVDYVFKVKAICGGNDGESNWSIEYVFYTAEQCPDETVCIGIGHYSNANLPYNTTYDYSFSQQIYTAEELGLTDPVDITSVQFYNAFFNDTRVMRIYMIHTTNSTFNNSFFTAQSGDLVFEGTVTFKTADWNTINFDRPFRYNGNSQNICLAISASSDDARFFGAQFLVFDAPEPGQGIYIVGNNNPVFDPTTGYATGQGIKANVKNCVRFGYESATCKSPTNLTVNYNGENDDNDITNATITWDNSNSDTNFILEINGTTKSVNINSTTTIELDETTITVSGTGTSFILSNLELATNYTVRLKCDCGNGDFSNWSNTASFTTVSCYATDRCRIRFDLEDIFSNSWDGAGIEVIDIDEGRSLGTVTRTNSDNSRIEMSICRGHEIKFVWHTGRYDNECIYDVYYWQSDVDNNTSRGETIFSGQGAMDEPFYHTVNCSPCPAGLTATNITDAGATLDWHGSYEYFNLRYRHPVQSGEMATIILNYPKDIWGDNSGYQILLDPTATAYDNSSYADAGYFNPTDAADIYSAFEYKLPANADYDLNTTNIVAPGQSDTIQIPAGIYDYFIVNPSPAYNNTYIVHNNSNFPGHANNYPFELGNTYIITITGNNYEIVNLTHLMDEWTVVENIRYDQIPYRIENLTSNTQYEWQVQGSDQDNDPSKDGNGTPSWSEIANFTTALFSVPFGKWQAISIPVHDNGYQYVSIDNVSGLNEDNYDLFRYNESSVTWENQKDDEDNNVEGFNTLDIGRGYIYRCSIERSLHFNGVNNLGDYSIALTASGSSDLKGFNLVGNPYPYRVLVDRAFYSLNADGTWQLHPNGDSIDVAQGILVYTPSVDTLTFYATTRSTNPGKKGCLPPVPNEFVDMTSESGVYGGTDDDTSMSPSREDDGAGRFVYQDDDHLVITATGTLQAFDVMGRLLFSREVSGSKCEIPTLNFPSAGVYVLRLDGKSQKIVIN